MNSSYGETKMFKVLDKNCRNLGEKEAFQWFESVTRWKK